MIRALTKKEIAFYLLVFISGLVYQPNWVYDNFWGKANFYDSLPFTVYFWQLQVIYALILVPIVWGLIRAIKRYL